MTDDHHRRRREHGYTLVELMVVLAILGLLAGIAVPKLITHYREAKVQTAKVQVDNLGGVLDLYHLDVGSYPTERDGLAALVERPPQAQVWNGPYLNKRDSLTDPWGRPYVYRFPGQHGAYDLYSLGADGKEGGDGEDRDIKNW